MKTDDCDDGKARRTFEELSQRFWPAFAAMGDKPHLGELPTTSTERWLAVARADAACAPGPEPGMWMIERPAWEIDDLWLLVHAAVRVGWFYAAKCSTTLQAAGYGGVHLICVYARDSSDLVDVRQTRTVLRQLGISEVIGYKTVAATRAGRTAPMVFLLRE